MRAAVTAGAALIIGIAAGWGGTHWLGGSYNSTTASRLEAVRQQLEHDSGKLAALQSRYDALEGQLLVEESTRKSLEASLHTAQAELSSARERLAFFDQLLPPGPNGSVGVRALDIEVIGPTLYYRALLSRHVPGANQFKGALQFVAQGTENGEPAQYILQPPTTGLSKDSPVPESSGQTAAGATVSPNLSSAETGASGSQDPLHVVFDQFQRVEGLLALPPGFVPEVLTLNVLEGKAVRASRRIDLPGVAD